jgi:hypothetical protein
VLEYFFPAEEVRAIAEAKLSKNYFWQHSTPLSRLTGGCGR